MNDTNYEEKNKPENQELIQGIPFNPVLREDFNVTPNDDRDKQEISDWWEQPYICTTSWEDVEKSFGSEWRRRTPDTDHEKFIQDIKKTWHKTWENGTRYEVYCLDGGAWDRATVRAMVGSLSEALSIAHMDEGINHHPQFKP